MAFAADDTKARFKSRRFNTTAFTEVDRASLENSPVLGERDPVFLGQLAEYFDAELFREGEHIVKEGDVGHKLYFLHKGSVAVLNGPGLERVTTLPRGSVFGEMPLFGTKGRKATILALELCDCRSISHCVFKFLMQRFPHEHAHFAGIAARRQKELDRLQKERASKEIENRVSEMFCWRRIVTFPQGMVVRSPMRDVRRRVTTGDGSNRETASRQNHSEALPDFSGVVCAPRAAEAAPDYSPDRHQANPPSHRPQPASTSPSSPFHRPQPASAPPSSPSRGETPHGSSSCSAAAPPRPGTCGESCGRSQMPEESRGSTSRSHSKTMTEGPPHNLPRMSHTDQHARLVQKMRDDNTNLRQRLGRLSTRERIDHAMDGPSHAPA